MLGVFGWSSSRNDVFILFYYYLRAGPGRSGRDYGIGPLMNLATFLHATLNERIGGD